MAEQALESGILIGTIDTSRLSTTSIAPLSESALKHVLVEAIEPKRQDPESRGSGFTNQMS